LSSAGLSQKPLSPFTSNEVKRKENDQNQKDPDRPEKTLPNAVPSLLRVVKNPEGNEEINERD
jgi:hypothetical protein